MIDQERELLAELPSGDWAEVKIIQNPDGMMAGNSWAVLATAKSLRQGGRPVFIKFVAAAGPSAGSTTNAFTGKPHLDRLAKRLQRMRTETLPIVEILDVRITDVGSILIIMDRVTTLEDVIKSGKTSRELAARVMREVGDGNGKWHHFDICTKNLGLTLNGKCVVIDIDSVFLVQESEKGGFELSAPAWKEFRLPPTIRKAVIDGIDTSDGLRIPAELARTKQGLEVLLAAAESCLGLLPSIHTQSIDEWLNAWPRGSETPEVIEFWKRTLREAFTRSSAGNLADTATAFQRIGEIPQKLPIPTAKEAWSELEKEGLRLRNGVQLPSDLTLYASSLEEYAEANRADPRVWNELIAVAVSLMKDPRYAKEVCARAIDALPSDKTLAQWKRVVDLWGVRAG